MTYDWFDYFMWAMFGIVGLLVIGLIWTGVEEYRHCARWQTKTVYQEAYTSYIWTGKTMVPVYHPAGWVEKEVCVQPK